MNARGIAIVHHGYVFFLIVVRTYRRDDTFQQSYLVFGEGSAAGGHNILDASLHHRHHIAVTLHDVAFLFLLNGFLGKVDAIKVVPFLIDNRFGRILVFCRLVLLQPSSSESHHLTRNGVNGENGTPVVSVVVAVVFLIVDGSPQGEEIFQFVTFGLSLQCIFVPLVNGIAQLEFLDDIFPELSFLHEVG